MNRLGVVDLPADKLGGEVVASFFFSDQRPLGGSAALLDWRLNGLLTSRVASGELSGTVGERFLVGTNGKISSDWVLFCGGGAWSELDVHGYRDLLIHVFDDLKKAGFHRVSLAVTPLADVPQSIIQKLVGEILYSKSQDQLECLLTFVI